LGWPLMSSRTNAPITDGSSRRTASAASFVPSLVMSAVVCGGSVQDALDRGDRQARRFAARRCQTYLLRHVDCPVGTLTQPRHRTIRRRMKGVIMAGGFGTRLKPLTINRPKPMVPVANRPIMEHIVTLLRRHGITDLISILYFQPDHITSYFGDGSAFDVD